MNVLRRSLLIPGVLVGIAAGLALAQLWTPFAEDERSVSDQALETIAEGYYRDVDETELEDAAVRGMLRELRRSHDDRFSHYFDPETYREFRDATRGSFTGVGMAVSEVDQGLRVGQVYPDSPAEEAEIAERDVILAVDGESIAGKPAEAAAGLIKGKPGTEVALRVRTPGKEPRRVELTRARVRIPAVAGEMRTVDGSDVAYVRLLSFTEGAHGELRSEIERLDRRGAEGLVLDLRGNGGGLLNEAILIASTFVEEGTIASMKRRDRAPQEFRAQGEALPRRPIVVLVDRGTASAAEIVAAALSEQGIAELVGEKTFGKGTVQEVIRLDNGGALDLTIAEYLTSEGKSLAGEGIRPDVRVRDRAGNGDEAVDRALETLGRELDGS